MLCFAVLPRYRVEKSTPQNHQLSAVWLGALEVVTLQEVVILLLDSPRRQWQFHNAATGPFLFLLHVQTPRTLSGGGFSEILWGGSGWLGSCQDKKQQQEPSWLGLTWHYPLMNTPGRYPRQTTFLLALPLPPLRCNKMPLSAYHPSIKGEGLSMSRLGEPPKKCSNNPTKKNTSSVWPCQVVFHYASGANVK